MVGSGLATSGLIGAGVGVGVEVGVGSGVVIGVGVGVAGRGVGGGVTCCTGKVVATGFGSAYPAHITISEYKQDDPLHPSLQITFPLPCGPEEQLTPPCDEQQPLLASTTTVRSEKKRINNERILNTFVIYLNEFYTIGVKKDLVLV